MLVAKKDQLTADIAKLSDQIAGISDDIAEIDAAVAEATKVPRGHRSTREREDELDSRFHVFAIGAAIKMLLFNDT